MTQPCPVCNDDGWVDVLDEDGFPTGSRECERLREPDHAPFNATGLLPSQFDGHRATGAAA
jgi:hypothetical protein